MIMDHRSPRYSSAPQHSRRDFGYKFVMLDISHAPAGLRVTRLGEEDITDCAALSAEAGWNQTARDWAIMLKIGSGIGLYDDRQLVASTVALPYDGPIGFISMVLVTPSWQRRGLATWLTERCAAQLEAQGRTPMLDATPAGQGVYRKLGFEDGIALDRWRADGSQRRRFTDEPRAAGLVLRPVTDMDAIVAADARAFGARRAAVLRDLLTRRPDLAWAAWRGEALAGFVLGREGRTATHVGPLVADDDTAAGALLAQALERAGRAAVVDLARGRDALAAKLAAAGFVPVRPFTRMHRGDALPAGAALVAAIGPEFG